MDAKRLEQQIERYFDAALSVDEERELVRLLMVTEVPEHLERDKQVIENDNWNTSNLAYINVFREYDSVGQSFFYSWDMPNFDYYDTNGNPYTYSDSGVVNSNVTSANTAYLPIWKYWDGGYGYKFYFEYDTTTGGLKMWMRHCDPDGYPEGENYGEVPYECRNHTTEFYNGIDTEGNTSEVYTYRGGVWYKVGEFVPQV